MSDPVSSAQIRGARSMLGWSMVDLAGAAGVSVSTVKRLEDDAASTSRISRSLVRRAFERAGIGFERDGAFREGVWIRTSCRAAAAEMGRAVIAGRAETGREGSARDA